MEAVTELASRYSSEFGQAVEELRQRSVAFGEGVQRTAQEAQQKLQTIEPEVQQKRGELTQALQDMEPLADPKSAKVLELFAWTAVVQFSFRVSFLVGAYLLAPVIGLALSRNGAAIIAYVLLPYLAYLQLQQSGSDELLRHRLLNFAALEGLATGYLLSRSYLATMQPLSAITPLVIALSVHLLGPKLANSRPSLYGAAIGGGVVVHLVIGVSSAQLSVPYFLLTLLHAGIGFAVLQTFYKFGSDQSHLYSYAYFMLTLFAQGLVFFLFGGPAESYHAD